MEIKDLNSELELKRESEIIPETEKAPSAQKDMSPKEILTKRGLCSKTFQKGKGVFETKYYRTPIHLYDAESNSFVEAEKRVVETEDKQSYQNDQHDFKINFYKENAEKALYSVSKEEKKITAIVKSPFGESVNRLAPEPMKKDTELNYPEVIPDTDYRCSVVPCGIKTSILIRKADPNRRYGFCFAFDGLKCEKAGNSLQFFSAETETPAFAIFAPYMTDASGRYSERVSLVPFEGENGKINVDIVPEAGWLNEKEREYPIRVEWTLREIVTDIPQIAFEESLISADGKLEVGGSAVPFRMVLPKRNEGMIRKKTELLLQCENVPVADDREFLLALDRVIVDPETGEPQTKRLTIVPLAALQTEYAFDVTSEETVAENASYSLQLCEMADGVLNRGVDSPAVLLNISPMSEAALFSVTETDGTSEQDGTSGGESGNLGSVATYEVDIVSGLLNMEMKDFAWEGNRMPVSISHSFRGQYANNPYLWGHAGTNPFSNMQIGLGWRLNLMQCMIHTGVCSDHNQSYWLKDTYTYIDDSGEELIFAQCECESGSSTCTTYEDVNGLGYTYEASTGIMKKGAEQYHFQNGKLTKITNEYGDYMTIVYSGGKINCVTDGVNRAFSFQYDGNNLIAIAAPNNAAVSFSYCSNRLCCASFPNGQTLSFTYDSNSGLPTAVTVGGSCVESITTNFNVSNEKITRIRANGSKRSVAFEYWNGKQTVITDCEDQDGDQCHQIKHYRVYLHEHSDKNYSYYESGDESKIHVTGEHGIVVPYTEPGMEIGNLKCQNLLADHNFDTTIGDLKASHPVGAWRTNLRDNFVQFDPPEKMPGQCAAYLINWAKQYTDDGIWQNVTLESGKDYVFSCYLKLTRANTNGNNKGVYLKVKSNNGGSAFVSQKITARNDFRRVALPFHVESGCGTSFSVGIYIDDYIHAKVIAPQLEEGTYLSPYNYLTTRNEGTTVGVTSGTPQTVATVYVPTGKDAKETFTLSGYVEGSMIASGCSASLLARIYYFQTSQERRSGDHPSDKFSIPIYSISGTRTFVMFQFSKSRYRGIEKIEIECENNQNTNSLTFTNLQLVRNSYADGLSEEDFAGTTDNTDSGDDPETIDRVTDDAEEVETIVFEEVKDGCGNALTSTNFQNGEFGTIYGESKFDDTDPIHPNHDEGNNKTEEIDARGNSTHYEYDPVTSKPTAVIDRCENRTEYTYDASGRTTSVLAANGGTVGYTYNAYDDLTKIERGDGQAYNMAYDPFRNLTGVQVGNQDLVSYTYKAGTNRLKAVTYANGSVQTLTYDRFGNVVTEVWMQGNIKQAEYRYSYDASRNLVKTVDILGRKMYNISRSGEKIASVEEYNIGWNGSAAVNPVLVGTMFYSFDSNGKQFRKKYVPADGSQEQKYVFEFKDEQNVAVQLPTGAVSHAKSDHFGRKVFDELQLGKGFLNRTFTYHDGVVSEKHEEENKRVSDPTTTLVKEIKFANGRTIVYEYDNEERITKVVDSEDGTRRYEYDSLGQLTKEERLTGTYFAPELCEEIDEYTTVNEMTYDLYGNITEKNGIAYGYDGTWKDKLTSYNGQSISYDANGNPTTYLGHTLAWEKGRQLKQFGNYSYKYNNDGIRIEKTENCKTHKYILDGTNILKEIVEDTCCNCNGYVNEYLYDLDGTVCGLKHNSTPYYFYKNLQGDVIAITDETGAIVAKYSYDAWGKCVIAEDNSDVGIAEINPFRYRSYYYDAETSIYYIRSRYYTPEIGRFLNNDVFGYAINQIGLLEHNLFIYCGNDPVNSIDVDGFFTIKIYAIAAVTAAVIAAIVKIVENYTKGYRGRAIFRGVLGASIGSAVNVVLLMKLIKWGQKGIVLAAFAAAAVQSVFDFAEGVLIDKKYRWQQLTYDFVLNFAATLIGNYIGGKRVYINGYWFQPQKIGSFFTKSYGKRLIAQTGIGAVVNLLIGLIRKGLEKLSKR